MQNIVIYYTNFFAILNGVFYIEYSTTSEERVRSSVYSESWSFTSSRAKQNNAKALTPFHDDKIRSYIKWLTLGITC